jgi:outer membrane immunogenic protein
MKKLLLTSAAFIALGATSYAADLPAPMAAVEPMPVVAPYSWTGFYLGVHAGYGWGDRHFDYDDDSFLSDCGFGDCDISTAGFDYDPDGWLVGGQIGANYQWNWLVLGVEADASWAHLDDDLNIDPYFGEELDVDIKVEWLATIRGRLGLAFDRFMIYGTGGVAFAGIDTDATWDGDSDSDSATHTGWTAGLGVEGMITQHLTAKLEYLYADFGEEDFDYTDITAASFGQADLELHLVRAGLNYKF